MYADDDLLMLSGIQHYAFCPRQWALIHIEQQWQSNHLTLEGDYLHERVDDPSCIALMRNVVTLRAVPLVCRSLGVYGISDAIELHPTTDTEAGIQHPKYAGYFMPYPVEYKHGKPKSTPIDEVQLCAQALSLEEQYAIHIRRGALYYAEIRHREEVEIDEPLRSLTRKLCTEMHSLYTSRQTPPATKSAKCRNCSLLELCMPQIGDLPQTVSKYLQELHHA